MFSEKVNIMMSQTLLLLSSVLTTWIIVMGSLYVFKEWVYANFPVAWNRISLWLTVSMLLIGVSLLLVHVVANNWLSLIATVIIPRIICLIALHMFMVLFKSYMTMRYQQILSKTKFFTTLAILYALFLGGTWMTLAISSPVFTYFTDMIVYFLLQGSVIAMALVSVLLSGVVKQVAATSNTTYQSTTQDSVQRPFTDDTDQW